MVITAVSRSHIQRDGLIEVGGCTLDPRELGYRGRSPRIYKVGACAGRTRQNFYEIVHGRVRPVLLVHGTLRPSVATN
jgi:hypothetical protein